MRGDARSFNISPATVIFAACAISLLGFGVRSSYGLFMEPVTLAKGWSRESFALALAVQNLLWGAAVPAAGALADRYGPLPVLALGAVMYALGTWGMAIAATPLLFHMTAGVLTGLGVAFASFSIALAAIAKAVGPDRRSLALGLGTAAGSLGQVVFAPLGQMLISSVGWHAALLVFAASVTLIIPLALMLPRRGSADGEHAAPGPSQTLSQAIAEAVQHRGFRLLCAGFFVCGFHVAFIAVHFPAYVTDLGLPAGVGSWALSLIGLMNLVGSFLSGMFGQRHSKKYGLSGIYLLRGAVILALIFAPKTQTVILLFAAAMGLLWLSTVPLTSGLVAQIFGVRYMATLFGLVFFAHQVGSFAGVWLGGALYDLMGNYDAMWWAGVALALLAAVLHMPINDAPVAARRAAASVV